MSELIVITYDTSKFTSIALIPITITRSPIRKIIHEQHGLILALLLSRDTPKRRNASKKNIITRYEGVNSKSRTISVRPINTLYTRMTIRSLFDPV